MADHARPTPPYQVWLLPLTAAVLALGIILGRAADTWYFAPVALCLGTAAIFFSRFWRRTAAVLVAVCAAGFLLGWRAYHPAQPAEGDYTVRAVVIDEICVDEAGQLQTVLGSVTLDGTTAANAYWTCYLEEGEAPPDWLVPGASVELTARVYHPEGQVNPGGFSFQEYLLQRGVHYGLYGHAELRPAEASFTLCGAMAALRHHLSADLMSVMGDEAGGYAAAMLLGVRDFIPEDDRAAFSALGIAHILSVSGFHAGILAGMLLFLLRPLPLSRRWRLAAEALLLFGYCLLTGGNAPVIRAALLILWRELSRIRHHQILPLHMLSATAIIQLLFNPTLLTSASFQLTYSAMLGLLLVCPRLRKLRAFPSRRLQRLWDAFAASLSAQMGIVLPQLYWFGQLPLPALLLNIPVLALGSWLILLYWVTLAALPIPGLRTLTGQLSAGATHAMLAAVRALAELPLTLWLRQPDWLFALGWALMLLSAAQLLPRRLIPHRRRLLTAGLALMLTLFIPLPENTTEYTMFSVGNADAALLQDRDMTVVIDAGDDGQALAGYLHQRRRSVDALIITHLHIDHACGVQALLDEGIPIRVCYLPLDAFTPVIDEETLPVIAALEASGTELRYLRRGDVIDLPSGRLTVLWPHGRITPDLDANDANLVLQADIAGATMLLTGDLTGAYEPYAALPSDILHIAHHGSTDATSANYLAAVDPQLLLLSNRLASREERMQAAAGGIPLYTTNRHGAVTVRFLGNGHFSVSTMK